jgi:hypothetical protein
MVNRAIATGLIPGNIALIGSALCVGSVDTNLPAGLRRIAGVILLSVAVGLGSQSKPPLLWPV